MTISESAAKATLAMRIFVLVRRFHMVLILMTWATKKIGAKKIT
jgi:hypothetical protein